MTVLKLSKKIENQERVLEVAEKKLGDTDYNGVVNKINEFEAKILHVKSKARITGYFFPLFFCFGFMVLNSSFISSFFFRSMN